MQNKIKIYEIAKELNISDNEVIEKAKDIIEDLINWKIQKELIKYFNGQNMGKLFVTLRQYKEYKSEQ